MAFGKKNIIDLNPLHYNLGLIGSGGIGKTTIIKEVCEKLVGEDGYLFIECYKEAGADAISGINYINCPDWNSDYDEFNNAVGFKVLLDDILENKNTDYPNLKTVVIDTYDQLKEMADKEVVRLHNKKYPDKRVDSVAAAFGGFMRGDDMADSLMLDSLWALKSVGVSFIVIGHTKTREIVDPISNSTYTQLTTDMPMRSFNKLKTKLHCLGVCYLDRDIVTEKKKDGKEKGIIKSESRRICFRDDEFALDSKSRFADIVDEIPFDSDAFIKALQDAIEAEANKSTVSIADQKKAQTKRAKEAEKIASENSAKARENKAKEELEEHREEYLAILQEKFKDSDAEVKDKAKSLLKESGVSKFTDPELDITILKQIAELFN